MARQRIIKGKVVASSNPTKADLLNRLITHVFYNPVNHNVIGYKAQYNG